MDPRGAEAPVPNGGGPFDPGTLRRDLPVRLPPDRPHGGCHGPDPDIFLAVLRAIHTYDEGKAAFRTWLFRIAANKVIDARRRARPPTQALEDQEVPLEEDFAAQVADRLLLDQIEAYVSALDAQTQAIFRLRLYGERTFPEIAAALEVPEPAVKAKYYRLMGRLRKEFDPHD